MVPIIYATLHLRDLIQLKLQYQPWGITNKYFSTCLFDVSRFFHAHLCFRSFRCLYAFLFVLHVFDVYIFWCFHVILVFTRLYCSHVCLIFTHLWRLLVLLIFSSLLDVDASIRYFHVFLIFKLSFGNC